MRNHISDINKNSQLLIKALWELKEAIEEGYGKEELTSLNMRLFARAIEIKQAVNRLM